MLKEQGVKYEYGTARLEDRAGILADIERVKPTHVLNAAGVTGRPNVDWCESHKVGAGRKGCGSPGVRPGSWAPGGAAGTGWGPWVNGETALLPVALLDGCGTQDVCSPLALPGHGNAFSKGRFCDCPFC